MEPFKTLYLATDFHMMWWLAAIPLILMAAGLVMALTPAPEDEPADGRIKGKARQVFGGVFFCVAAALFCAFAGAFGTGYLRASHALHLNSYKVAEGPVTQVTPPRSHGDGNITVDGVTFHDSHDIVIGMGLSAVEDQMPIHVGTYVRVDYLCHRYEQACDQPEIIRFQIKDSPASKSP